MSARQCDLCVSCSCQAQKKIFIWPFSFSSSPSSSFVCAHVSRHCIPPPAATPNQAQRRAVPVALLWGSSHGVVSHRHVELAECLVRARARARVSRRRRRGTARVRSSDAASAPPQVALGALFTSAGAHGGRPTLCDPPPEHVRLAGGASTHIFYIEQSKQSRTRKGRTINDEGAPRCGTWQVARPRRAAAR